jgi:diguanylate cyclase (GGDEF)-like protein
MISLRKHIDYKDPLTESTLAALRSSLLAMAECADRAVPGLGQDLNLKLAETQRMLSGHLTQDRISNTQTTVERELAGWANRAWEYHAENVKAIREIIAVVTQTTDSVTRRDESWVQQLGSLNKNLQSLAQVDDLPSIQRSILDNTRALKFCVEKMATEGKESLKKLSREVAEYRRRLEEAERIAETDPLTQLANRRAFERQIGFRIATRQVFSLIMMDLDGFKQVNDQFGHLAGDDLLRQFAAELRTQFRPGDLLARWGGDEFVALLGVPLHESEDRIVQIGEWVLGEYKVKAGENTVKVRVGASIGVVQWNGVEGAPALLARADARVYALKRERVSPADSTPESGRAAGMR